MKYIVMQHAVKRVWDHYVFVDVPLSGKIHKDRKKAIDECVFAKVQKGVEDIKVYAYLD